MKDLGKKLTCRNGVNKRIEGMGFVVPLGN